ncbi:MAG: hypothetical protein ACO1OB_17920 [Archangium sp.]
MRFIAVVVLGVSSIVFAQEDAAVTAAQALADADRTVDSAHRTGDEARALEERRDGIARTWFAERIGETETKAGQKRLAALLQLLEEAHRRKLTDVVATLEEKVVRDLEPIRREVEADVINGGELAALGRIFGVLENVPRGTAPWKVFEPITDGLRDRWTHRRKDAKGPAEAHAWSVMLAFLDGRAEVPLPVELTKLRHAAPPRFSSACDDVTPEFPSPPSIDVTPTLTVSACTATHAQVRETRSKQWTQTLYRQELRTEFETVSVPVTTNAGKQCTSTTDFSTGRLSNGGYGATSTATETCGNSTQTTYVQEQREVKRMVQVPYTEERTENFQADVRRWRITAEADLTIDGDGLTLTRRRTLFTELEDVQFKSEHVGGSTFDDAATTKKGRQALSSQVEAFALGLEREWTLERGKALAARATSVDERMRAAVLLAGFEFGLQSALSKDLSLPPQLMPALLGQTVDVSRSGLPRPPALQLPPPSADLEASLTRYEKKVGWAKQLNGIYVGPFLGVGTQETLDQSGLARFGITAGYAVMWQPLFSIKTPFLLRVGGDLQVGWLGYFQMDVSPRVEVGFHTRPVTLAAVGMTELGFGAGGADAEAVYKWPFFVAAGYGARLQLRAGPVGLDVTVTRMHRTWPGSPIALRGEGKLFVEAGEQARFFVGLTMMTTDDAGRGLTSPTRWFSSVIGLHQIF